MKTIIKNSKTAKKLLIIAIIFLAVPLFALAVNDVQIINDTEFDILTADTAAATTIEAAAGGQVTNFDVEANYIDITLDNLSNATFTVAAANRFFKITKISGSNDYTVSPACPTTTATLTGTGATVVLRLEVQTTDGCVTPPPPGGGGGGGGSGQGGYMPDACPNIPNFQSSGPCAAPSSPTPASTTPPADCRPGDTYSGSTGALCPSGPPIISSPSVCISYLNKTVKLGAVNDPAEVRKLQSFLRDREGFVTLPVTGYFGPLTLDAVKIFQAKYAQDILIPAGVAKPTGWVFEYTIKKINQIYCQGAQPATPIPTTLVNFSRDLKQGMTGADVRALQQFLNTHGFPITSSGPGSAGNETITFGSLTKAALAKFQSANDITPAVGYFGPKTRALINSL